MRIALIITGLGVGGAEKVVTGLADAFSEKGHMVLLVYLTGNAKVMPSDSSVNVVGLGVKSIKSLLSAYFKLRRMLKIFKPDVVHSHMFHANILARLLRLITPIPRLITTAHNTNDGGCFRAILYRLTDPLSTISTNVSDEAVAAYVKRHAVKPSRMITVHNGIPTSLFVRSQVSRKKIRKELQLTEDSKMVIAVGSHTEQKDYPNLFRALTNINFKSLKLKVFIVGDGPLKSKLKDMIDDLNLSNSVELLGVRNDVPDLMSAADVFVLSSAYEGFPLVVGEAMSCECIVVATDCGGVREFVGSTGYLVPPRQPSKLADALVIALALSPPESTEIGHAARQRIIEYYSHESSVDKWLSLYANLRL